MANKAETFVSLLMLLMGLAFLSVELAPDGRGGNRAAAQSSFDLPLTLILIWIGLAGLIFLQSFTRTLPEAPFRENLPRLVATIAVSLATVIGTVYFGYLVPVTIGLIAFLLAMGERRPLRLTLAVLGFGPGLWFLFHHILLIRLPSLFSASTF